MDETAMPAARSRSEQIKTDAYSEVRSLILGGHVRPGQRLSHRSLAKDLGLSRSPVREALLQLEAEGLIEHRPQSGVYLRELSLRDLEELYDMREIIEPYAAERAARCANDSQLDRLRRTCEEFTAIAKRQDLATWLESPEHRRRLSLLDREFHSTILTAANNRIARRFFENAQVLSLVFSWNFMATDPEVIAARCGSTAKHHKQIYECIRKRDQAAARRYMRSHIQSMSKQVLASA